MERESERREVTIRGKKLELEFPCEWTYAVFGPEEARLRAAIVGIVQDAQHTLELSRTSKGGKYRSLHLVVTVRDDAHRLAIFKELHEHPDVAYVL